MNTPNSSSSSKHHCMVVFAHYPEAETRVQRQSEVLIDRGYDVDILCLRYPKEAPFELVNGAQVHRLPVSRSYANVGFLRQFFEYLAFFIAVTGALFRLYPSRRYPVVQVHNLPDFMVFAAWLPKLFGARIILDLHDLMPEFFAARTGHEMNSRFVRFIALQEQLSCRFADHVITVTDVWKETLISRGVPAGKVSVVMNVADDRIFKRSKNGHKPTQLPDRPDFHLFYHGNLVARYGIDLILEAITRLRESTPGLVFTIHNPVESSYKKQLAELSHQLGIEDRVRFSNELYSMAELPNLISTADVGLVPYRRDIFTDGILPTKLMEYTALGIPVIAARTPAIEAYFNEEMVQFFAAEDVDDLADAIHSLYLDRERLQTLSHNADCFNQSFNWTKIGTQYVALVERLGQRRKTFGPSLFRRSGSPQ